MKRIYDIEHLKNLHDILENVYEKFDFGDVPFEIKWKMYEQGFHDGAHSEREQARGEG